MQLSGRKKILNRTEIGAENSTTALQYFSF